MNTFANVPYATRLRNSDETHTATACPLPHYLYCQMRRQMPRKNPMPSHAGSYGSMWISTASTDGIAARIAPFTLPLTICAS